MKRTFRLCFWILLIPLTSCSIVESAMANLEEKNVFAANNSVGERHVIAQFDLPRGETVHALAWSPDSRIALVTSQQGSFGWEYNVAEKRLGKKLEISDFRVQASGLIVFNDGYFIAPTSALSSSRNAETSRLTKFDSQGNSMSSALSGISAALPIDINILRMVTTSDGSLMAIAGVDTTAKSRGLPPSQQWPAMVVSLKSGKLLLSPDRVVKSRSEIVRDISIASQAGIVAILSNAGEVRLWKVDKDEFVKSIQICEPGTLGCGLARISRNGEYLLANGNGSTISAQSAPAIWSIKSKRSLGTLAEGRSGSPVGVDQVSWSPDSTEVALSDTGHFSIWRVNGGIIEKVFNREMPKRSDGTAEYSPKGLSYSDNGMLAVAAGNHIIIYK